MRHCSTSASIAATGRRRFVVSRGVHPHSRETLATYSVGYGAEVVEVGLEGGLTDAAALAAAVDGETAAVFLQSPNFLGAVEDVEALGAAAKEHGALLIVACDPITLSILKPPGECGADIALGEGQPLGNRLDFGGPSFGFFCATEARIAASATGLRVPYGVIVMARAAGAAGEVPVQPKDVIRNPQHERTKSFLARMRTEDEEETTDAQKP